MKNWIALMACAGLGLAAAGNAVAGNAAAGKEKSAVCAACHGEDGNKPLAPDYPKLAGQPADYLEKALKDYKTGKRKNPLMAPQAQNLSKKDIQDLAAYFASQKGDLGVKY
jgi:cytochrome c553